MSHVISIDPGVNDVGVACWKDAGLASAALVRKGKADWLSLAHRTAAWVQVVYKSVDVVVIEKPQVYRQHLLKGDPNDLISLAIVVGAIANAFKLAWPDVQVVIIHPREWKGQLPKKVSTERSRGILSDDELDCVQLPAKSLQHNVWDAVGIGLHYVGRK